jgi:hypothetical protein
MAPLTSAQMTALNQSILSSPDMAAFVSVRDLVSIATAYNAPSSGGQTVWTTQASVQELLAVMNWTEYLALSQQNRDALQLVASIGSINAALPGVATAIGTIFASSPATLAAITAAMQRPATRAEALFLTAVAPSNVTALDHQLSPAEIGAILFNPDGSPINDLPPPTTTTAPPQS